MTSTTTVSGRRKEVLRIVTVISSFLEERRHAYEVRNLASAVEQRLSGRMGDGKEVFPVLFQRAHLSFLHRGLIRPGPQPRSGVREKPTARAVGQGERESEPRLGRQKPARRPDSVAAPRL